MSAVSAIATVNKPHLEFIGGRWFCGCFAGPVGGGATLKEAYLSWKARTDLLVASWQ